ncbi:MAG TPA: GC-type dockerin domain-anchored protein [Phycisphaerales bacterium]|nr:GC-type dockerin domain-anchored protein [Phycisphaerales bacterium]
MLRLIRFALAAPCVAGLASHAADDALLVSVRDNTLCETDDGSLSNGAGQHCFAGTTALGEKRRALVAFDVAGFVPEGSTIVGVTLTLNMSKTIVGGVDVAIHRVMRDWGEGASDAVGAEGQGAPAEPGDATWLHRFYPGEFWDAPGGDFDPAASGSIVVGAVGAYVWGSTERMVADVQAWLDDPASNFGWTVIADETVIPGAKRFDTREHPDPAVRPVLRVEFEPPCIADWNRDGEVTTLDFLAFLNDWAAGDPRADLNGDGVVNTIDFLAFLNAWSAGCG